MKKLLIYDLETGSLEPSTGGITQVCAGICEFSDDWSQFEVLETFDVVVQECPGLIYSDEAMRVQGRTREDLANGIRIGHAIKGVEELAVRHFGKTKSATPYGVNVKFDVDFTDANCRRFKLNMPFNFVYRDICQWFRLLQDLGAHDVYGANLDAMAAHYGIESQRDALGRHDASEDVRMTAEAIRHMMADFHSIQECENCRWHHTHSDDGQLRGFIT
jgi:DNA polymerase-3 subunit epsilon